MTPAGIVLTTLLVIAGYVVVVYLMAIIFFTACEKFEGWSLVTKLVAVIPLTILGLALFVIDIIQTIATALLGIHLASMFRDWWHKGAK